MADFYWTYCFKLCSKIFPLIDLILLKTVLT